MQLKKRAEDQEASPNRTVFNLSDSYGELQKQGSSSLIHARHGDGWWLLYGALFSCVSAKRCDDDMQRKSAWTGVQESYASS